MSNQTVRFAPPLEATDDLGRVCTPACPRKAREVGLFYFLWLGEHGSDKPVYDNSKILAKDPGAPISKKRWAAAGGGVEYGAMHWWGEPLFHYYTVRDRWVVRKHVRMFIDAGIDFLMIDATNAGYYPEASLALFETLDEFVKDGWNVPKVGFYTYSQTGRTIQDLYEHWYLGHPEYRHLWYCRGGKPFLVGDLTDKTISDEARAFFTIDDAYMDFNQYRHYTSPSEFTFSLEGNPKLFAWIDFSDTPTLVRNEDGTPKMMTVSVAEICETTNSTYSYLWNTKDRTRSWDGKQNRNFLPGEADAWKYGYNFQRQLDAVLEADPPLVFICGWNEWLAGNWASDRGWKKDNALGKYTSDPGDMCMFVDQFDINNNRDIEPMKGGYGDAYYLQMVSFIRRYKGTADAVRPDGARTIDMGGDWSQWDGAPCAYRNPVCDASDRDKHLYDSWDNKTPEARDNLPTLARIRSVKACRDAENCYFYAETADDLTGLDADRRMSLLLRVRPEGAAWCGYDYVLRRVSSGDSDKALLEKYDGSAWRAVGAVCQRVEGNKMMIRVPASMLGGAEGAISFKWADNWREDDGVWTFYRDGDCAPYGRFNCAFPGMKG